MKASRVVLLLLLLSAAAFGQTWDTSGNAQLSGAYYFRHVVWHLRDTFGTLDQAVSTYGTITFDGNGNYSVTNTQVYDTNYGYPQTFTMTGTYSVAASGFGFISSPVSTGDNIQGLVSHGIFVGSTTEAGYNDLFIAAQLPSPAPVNSFFQGAYTLLSIDCPSFTPLDTRNTLIHLSADGSGGIGTVNAAGYVGNSGSLSQNLSGIRYSFSNGAAVVQLGGDINNNLIAGTEYLYFSPDGNFVFGGAPNGWDMIVGVKNGTGTPAFNGLYYQAGMYQDETNLANGSSELFSLYGSLKANGTSLLNHQRLLTLFNSKALDYTYSQNYSLNSDGSYDDSYWHYLFGAGGAIRIGYGRGITLGVNVAVQAPAFTPSGVYIYPTGVVNAASSALFTAGIAPGELITIYGSNMAPGTAVDATFPLTLNGVQVMVNNRPAPVYVVSPGQISAVVPFATTELIASIKVINNGVSSNTVPAFINLTAPGVFTLPTGGIGYAAALHTDYTLISKDSPAKIGETVSLYVTGLGAVSPAVADGAPGPATPPYSLAVNPIVIYIGGVAATTSYIGLAPQLVGLYQINVTVPTGVASGDASVDVAGPDFYTTQAVLPIQ
ncbi:MAG: IPT/TIG domain-containing protein [Bryobacteraceae bacterium]